MNNERRGFFKKIGIGASAIVLGTNINADEIDTSDSEFYTKVQPYENARIKLINNPEKALDYLKFNTTTKEISVLSPMSLEIIYYAAKELWKIDNNYTKYDSPLINITPEMFDLKEDWVISLDTIKNVRKAGFASYLDDTSRVNFYACVEILTERGLIFNDGGIAVENGEAMKVKNGNIEGFYQLSKADKPVKLDKHLKQILGLQEVTGMFYRIP